MGKYLEFKRVIRSIFVGEAREATKGDHRMEREGNIHENRNPREATLKKCSQMYVNILSIFLPTIK